MRPRGPVAGGLAPPPGIGGSSFSFAPTSAAPFDAGYSTQNFRGSPTPYFSGRASLVDGFADVEDAEVWLHQVHIPQYTQATWTNVASRRKRKLLLHRSEIDKLARKVGESGLTIIPLSLYFKDGRAKVEIALARGKDVRDKRRDIADRDAKRQIERALKSARGRS